MNLELGTTLYIKTRIVPYATRAKSAQSMHNEWIEIVLLVIKKNQDKFKKTALTAENVAEERKEKTTPYSNSQKPSRDNNHSVVKRFSNCSKSYLMKRFLFQKNESIYIFTKSSNRYPIIEV